jgi:hypothetical protein
MLAGNSRLQKTERPRESAGVQTGGGTSSKHPTGIWLLGLSVFAVACGGGFSARAERAELEAGTFVDGGRQTALVSSPDGARAVPESGTVDDGTGGTPGASPLDASAGGTLPETGGRPPSTGGRTSTGGRPATGGASATGGVATSSDAGALPCVPVVFAAGLYCCCHPPDRSEACRCP